MKKYPYQGNINDIENIIYKKFEKEADRFVLNCIKDYSPQKNLRGKVIHDCVWGSVMFYPWELQIMDSPLLQRLRKINQLGLALYTYPSAHHSRFEHTIGVVAVASKMIESINGGATDLYENNFKIPEEHIFMIRLAALLHDVGHCFFSHLSETIYSSMKQFTELKDSFEIFKTAQAHEILGYVIINTLTYPFKGKMASGVKILLQNIGRMIVGAYVEPYNDMENNVIIPYYLTEMINGQFDADALDYLRRDSYATGLDLTYNLDRFLYKIRIVECKEQSSHNLIFGRHLTVPVSGVSTVEEMMYNKQMLTRYIYQHQKVMTVDSLVSDIANGLMISGQLVHPCDFLYMCDENIYMLQNDVFSIPLSCEPIGQLSDKKISDIVKKIASRDLPKKALILNRHTLSSINGNKCESVREISNFLNKYRDCLREKIYNKAVEINKQINNFYTFDMYDIRIAIPKYSLAKDYRNVFILSNDDKLVPLSDCVNLNEMADAYANQSWNAYVFAEIDILPLITVASMQVFEECGAVFDESVLSHLKHSVSVKELISKIKD